MALGLCHGETSKVGVIHRPRKATPPKVTLQPAAGSAYNGEDDPKDAGAPKMQRSEATTTIVSGETPLTDPRSLGVSVLFHGLIVLVCWLTILNVTLSSLTESGQTPMRAEIGPVDNRAEPGQVAGEGGGSPGEIGGLVRLPSTSPDDRNSMVATTQDPAEALLSEILPDVQPPGKELLEKSLPGPQTLGQGLIPGSGPGGGGGSGGGSGGGVGRGIGPGTQFFGARDHAHSFAYVIDCSGSMASHSSLEVAKRELLASLNQLPPDAEFSVVFYNMTAKDAHRPAGEQGPDGGDGRQQDADPSATGDRRAGRRHRPHAALCAALALRPEVIFFLTDADLMTNGDVNEILSEAGRIRIQAVEFGRGIEPGGANALATAGPTTGGAYLYIDVSKFPRNTAGY